MQSSKKRRRKKKSLQRYRALSDNCMENKVFVSKNDRQDRSLTGQVRDQAGHCPLTGRYLQPWLYTFNHIFMERACYKINVVNFFSNHCQNL